MPRASKPRLPKGQKLSEDPKYEHRIQDAIEGVASGKYKNLQVASHAENVSSITSCTLSQFTRLLGGVHYTS